MRAGETIFLVYAQQSYGNDLAYFAILVFGKNGQLDYEAMVRTYESEVDIWRLPSGDSRIGPFRSLEYLQKFSFAFSQRVEASEIVLLSVDAYNESVAKSSQLTEFIDNLLENGDIIKNVEGGPKAGIFNRLFH